MAKTYFTDEHEWIRVDGSTATVGITQHAQEQLGDLVFVDLPKVGAALKKGGASVVVESVKAASDVYAPCGWHRDGSQRRHSRRSAAGQFRAAK